jgi:small subunit ribosomal protein S6
MRDYEVVFFFKSAVANDDIEARVEKFHEKILAGADAEITAVEYWGKRELAYPIDDHRNGTYVVAQFTAPAEVLTEFERQLKLDEDLLRHLIVLSEGELPTAPSAREEEERTRKRGGDDDDDDDDDDTPPGDSDDEDGSDDEDEDED